MPIARMLALPAIVGSQLTHREILDERTRRLLRISDRIADTVVVNCQALRRHMIEEEHVPASRIDYMVISSPPGLAPQWIVFSKAPSHPGFAATLSGAGLHRI